MSVHAHPTRVIVGEPEVVQDATLAETSDAWLRLKAAATAIQRLQVQDGSIPAPDEARAPGVFMPEGNEAATNEKTPGKKRWFVKERT